jgi:hypothetical protein
VAGGVCVICNLRSDTFHNDVTFILFYLFIIDSLSVSFDVFVITTRCFGYPDPVPTPDDTMYRRPPLSMK